MEGNREDPSAQEPLPAAETTAGESPTGTASSEPAAAAKTRTRLLKDVEAEENAYIYKSLYRSLDDSQDKNVKQNLSETSDILADARRAKAEFFRTTSLPLAAKAKGCSALVSRLGESKNKQVAFVFFTVTVMMFTLPVVAVFVGMQMVAPRMGWDASLCGGFAGLGVAVAIMAGYTVYAFAEDAERVREERRKAVGATAAGRRCQESGEEASKDASSKKRD